MKRTVQNAMESRQIDDLHEAYRYATIFEWQLKQKLDVGDREAQALNRNVIMFAIDINNSVM